MVKVIACNGSIRLPERQRSIAHVRTDGKRTPPVYAQGTVLKDVLDTEHATAACAMQCGVERLATNHSLLNLLALEDAKTGELALTVQACANCEQKYSGAFSAASSFEPNRVRGRVSPRGRSRNSSSGSGSHVRSRTPRGRGSGAKRSYPCFQG